jgi:hypothetical protein
VVYKGHNPKFTERRMSGFSVLLLLIWSFLSLNFLFFAWIISVLFYGHTASHDLSTFSPVLSHGLLPASHALHPELILLLLFFKISMCLFLPYTLYLIPN